ncbi:MAG: hypothetical protein KF729_17895 [Sandaracinaceae bacterium]|nr:hypothetical protein [Sandaracinaceae bacterium]
MVETRLRTLGLVMALGLAGCPGSHGASDAGARDGAVGRDAGGPASGGCVAYDAHGEGACRLLLGFGWDGVACASIGGCECVGRDCGALFGELDACERAHAGCARCERMDVREEGGCEPVRGFFWDGADCRLLSGCSCVGRDCARVFPTDDACRAAYRACLAPSPVCRTDRDCPSREWCVEGACVPCDDSGTRCDILCPSGWGLYERNGCTPCECAPPNECVSDADCPFGALERRCMAGAFCALGCTPGDPSCCFGNLCVASGCESTSPPHGCLARGCPRGAVCELDVGCAPSSCGCSSASEGWFCTDDCGGGTCVASGAAP